MTEKEKGLVAKCDDCGHQSPMQKTIHGYDIPNSWLYIPRTNRTYCNECRDRPDANRQRIFNYNESKR